MEADRPPTATGSNVSCQDVDRYYRRYSFLLFISVLLVTSLFAIAIILQDIRYEQQDINQLGNHFDEYVETVRSRFDRLRQEMLELQASAESDLFESRHQQKAMPYAFRFFRDGADGATFHLDQPGPPLVRQDIGNLTGEGSITGRRPDFYREIAMALMLMNDFDALADNLQNLVWLYYYSRNHFALYYPWTPSGETRFEKESYLLNAWKLGLPENNPGHEPYWTETYFDSVGRGLMVSCLVPIYDADRFTGVAGADYSVDLLNDLVSGFKPERNGTLFLYDQRGNLLAHPRYVSASDDYIHTLKNVLPPALAGHVQHLEALRGRQFDEINGWRIMSGSLMHTPYTAVYLEPVPSRPAAILQRIGTGTIGLCVILLVILIMSLVLTYSWFIRPSSQFVRYILQKNLGMKPDADFRIPPAWRPWFDSITRIFDKNAELNNRMKARNLKLLEEIKVRQQVEQERQARDAFLKRVIDQSPFAIWIADAKGTLQHANPALKKFLNLTDRQLVDRYNVLQDPLVERQGLIPLIRTVFEEGKSISFTCKWDGNDIPTLNLQGSESVHIEATMFPIHNPQGKLTNVMLNWIDVTDRIRAEEEIRALNLELENRVLLRTRQLQEVNRELEDFIYSVSHDLRAPLRSISGFAQIIDRRYKRTLNDEARHYLDNIILASNQMGDLIDDLLQFSRLGRKSIKVDTVDLAGIFKTVLDTLSSQVEETGARVSLPDPMPAIRGDRTLATTVFVNLLENALKYHKPGEPPVIDIKSATRDQYVEISVIDDGIGIKPEFHEKIFNMFQRLHSQEEYPGTGIGLAAVKKSVQMMGGEVRVQAAPDGRTVFTTKFLPAEKHNNGD